MPVGTVVGELSAISDVSGDVLRYMVTSSEVGLKVKGTQLVTSKVFDYETLSSFKVSIRVINQLSDTSFATFDIQVEDIAVEEVTVIEVTAETLEDVNYSVTNYTSPTKLVFTNLTSILSPSGQSYKGNVYIYKTTNLVGVEFPKLKTVSGQVYIQGNVNLISVDMPLLETTGTVSYTHLTLPTNREV